MLIMIFKKLISVLLAVSLMFSFGIFAFATDTEDGTSSDTQSSVRNTKSSVPYYAIPPEYLYSLFDKVLDLYVEEHLYEFSREEVLEKMMKDMIHDHPEFYKMMMNTLLGTMDPYSAFHEASSGFLSGTNNDGVYGIVVSDTGESIVIDKVMLGSSAEKAGIMKGDIIVAVESIDVSSLPWNVVSRILSKPYIYFSEKNENGMYDNTNPEIEITIDRGGERHIFKLSKAPAATNELSYKIYEEEGVAHVTVTSFINESLDDEFIALINEISQKGIKKLVLDLRDNSGGALELALNMSEVFVDSGVLMCYGNSRELPEPRAVYSDTPAVEFDSISVLINGVSASAAELMASILKNCAGAILVGETSYGKAIGQTVYNLATGDTITITTYEMLDPNGNSYNGIGLIPDLEIKNVLTLYELPKLEIFNHVNYKEIVPGVYNDACLALEQRLEVLGLLRTPDVDGIWNDNTNTAVMIIQRVYTENGDGTLDDNTVTLITDLINSYKTYTYYEDTQFDVALMYHSSLSQAKRLIKEKEQLRESQAKLIAENQAYYESLAE